MYFIMDKMALIKKRNAHTNLKFLTNNFYWSKKKNNEICQRFITKDSCAVKLNLLFIIMQNLENCVV